MNGFGIRGEDLGFMVEGSGLKFSNCDKNNLIPLSGMDLHET